MTTTPGTATRLAVRVGRLLMALLLTACAGGGGGQEAAVSPETTAPNGDQG